MIRLNAHIGFQFTELPFLERFAAAAKAGFHAVEFPSPYEYDPLQIAQLLEEHQLHMVQFAAPQGATRGTTALCAPREEFVAQLRQAAHYAQALGCNKLHLMSGTSVTDLGTMTQDGRYRRNLEYALEFLYDERIEPLIEVISSTEMPGYLMSRFDLAEQMLEALPGLGLILDTYHTALLGEDCLRKLNQWWPRISHAQVADFPGRHEPGTGRIDFSGLVAMLEIDGYEGWVGCEYRPLTSTEDGLEALRNVLRSSRHENDRP